MPSNIWADLDLNMDPYDKFLDFNGVQPFQNISAM